MVMIWKLPFFFFFLWTWKQQKKARLLFYIVLFFFSQDSRVEKKTFARQEMVRWIQEATTLGGYSQAVRCKDRKERKGREKQCWDVCSRVLAMWCATPAFRRPTVTAAPAKASGYCDLCATMLVAQGKAHLLQSQGPSRHGWEISATRSSWRSQDVGPFCHHYLMMYRSPSRLVAGGISRGESGDTGRRCLATQYATNLRSQRKRRQRTASHSCSSRRQKEKETNGRDTQCDLVYIEF